MPGKRYLCPLYAVVNSRAIHFINIDLNMQEEDEAKWVLSGTFLGLT